MFLPLLFLLPGLCASASWHTQSPFSTSYGAESDSDYYKLKWPVKRVAIIGAGPSGMISYREFTRAGFEVKVFERDDIAGGNWHYTESEVPTEASIPNADVSVGDYVPSLPPDGVDLPYSEVYSDEDTSGPSYAYRRREHRAPKPVWKSLKSNAPSPYQQITELPWPAGTQWELTQNMLQRYMRSFASLHGINSNDDNPHFSYNTRVELVDKHFDDQGDERGWALTLKKLEKTGENSFRATWWKEHFDAVVVGTGRFNAPNIPPIMGLTEWADRFPEHISHSRQHRIPQPYTNKTVLIVGAATSGVEISRDINPVARQVYQSIRPDNSSVPHRQLSPFSRRMPSNTTIVGEIRQFRPISLGGSFSQGEIELFNGTIISGIDHILFATGYRYSFPFLPKYHNSSLGRNETAPRGLQQPLVTDGTHLRSLHLDLFYIEEPTIGFINMNHGMQSFTYAEYLSLALAKVWDNKAKLPSTKTMWDLHQKRVDEFGGYGKHFQFLGSQRTHENIRFFVGWLNDAAVKYGGRQINGEPLESRTIIKLWATLRAGPSDPTQNSSDYASHYALAGIDAPWELSEEESYHAIVDSIFEDDW